MLGQEAYEITPTTVSQTSPYKDNEASNNAHNAIDKDLSTSATTKESSGTAWIKLEFDKTYFVHKVIIHQNFYTDWFDPTQGCVADVAEYKACKNNNSGGTLAVYQGGELKKTCGTMTLSHGLTQAEQVSQK